MTPKKSLIQPEIALLVWVLLYPALFLFDLDAEIENGFKRVLFYLIFTFIPAAAGIWYGIAISKSQGGAR